MDFQHTEKTETSSQVTGGLAAVAQRRLEHVHRSGSAAAAWELVADKGQGCMADDFRTPGACYKVVESTLRWEQVDTAHLVMGGKNRSAP